MVRNYVRRDVESVSESHIKLPALESKLVVHSSINILRNGTLLFSFGLLKKQWLALINFGVGIFSYFLSYI